MRNLSCRRMIKLLPFYAGGDLRPDWQRKAAAHVATCGRCRRHLDGYDASRSLVAEAAAIPQFNPEFYAGIRGAVLSAIGRDRETRRPFFRRRWTYAVSLGVLLMAAAFMLSRHFRGMTPDDGGVVASAPPNQIAPLGPKEPGTPQSSKTPDKSQEGTAPGHRHSPTLAKRVRRHETGVAQNQEGLARYSPPPQASEDAPKSSVAQIEIQTSNPNIRIIWFAAKDRKETDDGAEPKDRK